MGKKINKPKRLTKELQKYTANSINIIIESFFNIDKLHV